MGRREFFNNCPCCPTTVECLGCLVPLMLEVEIIAPVGPPYGSNVCAGMIGGTGLLLYQLQPPFFDRYGWSGEVETDCGVFQMAIECSTFVGGYLAGMYIDVNNPAPCTYARGASNSQMVSTHVECEPGVPEGPQGPLGPGNLIKIEFDSSLSQSWFFVPVGDCECCGGTGNFYFRVVVRPA